MDFTIQEEQQSGVAHERELVPPGIHTMTIRSAEEGPNEYKRSEANPEGKCLKLCLATVEGSFKFVWHDIPEDLGWLASALARALAIEPVGGTLSLLPQDLIDQRLQVEISHYTSKAGKVSAVVKRYVPAGEPVQRPTPKPSVLRTKPVAKAAAASLGSDDIPF
jgi:hypothetical protein